MKTTKTKKGISPCDDHGNEFVNVVNDDGTTEVMEERKAMLLTFGTHIPAILNSKIDKGKLTLEELNEEIDKLFLKLDKEDINYDKEKIRSIWIKIFNLKNKESIY